MVWQSASLYNKTQSRINKKIKVNWNLWVSLDFSINNTSLHAIELIQSNYLIRRRNKYVRQHICKWEVKLSHKISKFSEMATSLGRKIIIKDSQAKMLKEVGWKDLSYFKGAENITWLLDIDGQTFVYSWDL